MKKVKIPPFIEIRDSTIPGAGRGAFTLIDICRGTRVGEYLGRRLGPQEYARSKCSRYVFEIKVDDRPVLYIDGRQLKTSNWTRYVNCPRTQREENLLAVQDGMRIFYQTKRDIRAGEELFVWYGPAYGQWLLGKSQLTSEES